MNLKILILLSGFPVFFLGKYIYDKDKNKEPNKLLAKLFIGGMGSCIITLILSFLLNKFFPVILMDTNKLDSFELFINVFFGIAFIEEFSKWIITYFISFNNVEFDEKYDCIVYSTYVALGFAFFENFFYVLGGGLSVAIVRAVSAVPVHTCLGIYMGKFLILSKQAQISNNKIALAKNIVLSILIPMIIHGLYDYLIFAGFYKFNFLFLIFIFLISIKEFKSYI